MTTTALVCLSESTGEIVAPDRPADVSVLRLRGYAAVDARLAVVGIDLAARIAALVDADKVASDLAAERRMLEGEMRAIEDALDGMFSPAFRQQHGHGIVLDTGPVRVCWAKPSVRWTQRVKPEYIAQADPDLAGRLGIERKVSEPVAPRITIRAPREVAA